MSQRPPRTRATARHAGGSRQVKVMVTGPAGVGTTTLIETLSEMTLLSAGRDLADREHVLKTERTVAMDFGRLTVDGDLVIHLFGVPGRERFDFLEWLTEGMLGFIVVVAPDRHDSLVEAGSILSVLRETAQVPYVVGVNRSDHDPAGCVETVRTTLDLPSGVPVVACNALDRGSVKSLLLELLCTVLGEFDAKEQAVI